MPNDAERQYALSRYYGSSEVAYAAVRDSYQLARLERTRVAPWAGGQAKGQEWLHNTTSGYLFQQMAGAAASHGMLGGGNPMAMSYGIQQLLGRGGAGFMDVSGGGGMSGVQRSFGGAGFVTDQFSQQLFRGLQSKLFGERGTQNKVNGLDMDQIGILMSELGSRRAISGERVGTFKNADLSERIAHYKATGNKAIASRLNGVKTEEDLDRKIAEATKQGKTTERDALLQVRNSQQILQVDKAFEDNTAKLVKGASGMIATLGNIMGSNDVSAMLKMAEEFSGKAIKSAEDARKVQGKVNEAVAFAESQGISGRSYLEEVMNQGRGVQAVLAQKYGLNPNDTGTIAALIGQNAAHQGVVSTIGQGIGQNTSAGEAGAQSAAGQMSRMMENPELIAAAKALKMGGLSKDQKGSLNALLQQYKGASTQDERRTAMAGIDEFFGNTFGQGAIGWLSEGGGAGAALKNADVANTVIDAINPEVTNSVVKRGTTKALSLLRKDQRGLIGTRAFETVMRSFVGTTQDKFADVLASGSPEEVRKFLASREGFMTDANGKSVSAAEMMAELGDPSKFGAVGEAFRSANQYYRGLEYTSAGATNEGEQIARGMTLQNMLGKGTVFGQRKGAMSFWDMLGKGFLTGADGEMYNEGILGLMTERDKDNAVTLQMDGDRIQATEKDLDFIGKRGNVERMLQAAGAKDLKEMSAMLRDKGETGSRASQALWREMTAANLKLGSADGKSIMAGDAEAYDLMREEYTMVGKRGRLENLAGMDAGALSAIKTEDVAAQKIRERLDRDGPGGLYEKAAGGDAGAIGQLQEMDKLMKGQLAEQMDIQIGATRQKLKDGGLSDKDKENEEKYLKRIDGAREAMTSESTNVMRVTNLIVENYQKGSDKEG